MRFLGRVLAVVLALSLASPAWAGDREYWRHSRGHFENTRGNQWEEKSPDATFRFTERDRTEQYVELYDPSRDCTVRLYNNQCWVRAPFTDYVFRVFYNGGWGSE